MERRAFLEAGVAGVLGSVFAGGRPNTHAAPPAAQNEQPARARIQDRICLFTDHLDDFDYSPTEVASMLGQLRVAGPDLTVRPGGLVAPERVAEELPKAAAAFREKGLAIPMISTGLTSPADPTARPILATMKMLGIRYFKLGYYPYSDVAEWQTQLEATQKNLAGLVELGREMDVQAGFHNHAGATVGGALWDSWEILRSLDAERVGFYFDPAQAAIEGGKHAWKLNFQRVSERLKMVAIKDFVWEKVDGRWQTRWCPLGEGMVNWPEFFGMLSRLPFAGPISLHIEYDPGGATRSARFENSFAAAERDLAFLRREMDRAFGAG